MSDVIAYRVPGYTEEVHGKVTGLAPSLKRAVLITNEGHIMVCSVSRLYTETGLAYAREWSVATGRPVREVYVPEALRPDLSSVEEF